MAAFREHKNPILNVEHLTAAYRQGNDSHDAVRDVSLKVYPGETLGLVGESGSGKTTLLLAIMRYLPPAGFLRAGTIELDGQDLCSLSDSEIRQVWGKQIALVPQDPQSSLNPSMRVGDQLTEALDLAQTSAKSRAIELLEAVHIKDPERVADSYPHQISGGMQQRVLIAMALSTDPALLVLDEPTTNLDVTTQAEILELIREQVRARGTTALYVTHNLGVVAKLCDRVAVMYAGELVESADTVRLYRTPLHPYTQGLLDSVPIIGETKSSVRLRAIQGQIPPIDEHPPGCIFAPRCPIAIDICMEQPPLYVVDSGRRTQCHRWETLQTGEVSARQMSPAISQPAQKHVAGAPVITLESLKVHFPLKRSLRETISRSPAEVVKAVDGVSGEVSRGDTLGLVGESGSGKTTLARAVMGLVDTTGGDMTLISAALPSGLPGRDLDTLRSLQMVFQDPDGALNPYLTIGESLRRPFISLLGLSRFQADAEAKKLLSAVHLPENFTRRLPDQLSGGEKQRVAIARAFATNPDLLICDEPVSSLDVSVQASILNLLNQLKVANQSGMIFISHDLAVVGYLADRIAVMYSGKLMEVGDSEDLFEPPYHPYTEALISAIPQMDPEAEQEHIPLGETLQSPSTTPGGCPFHSRCPRFLGNICIQVTPPWKATSTGKRIYCHIPLDELGYSQTRRLDLHHGSQDR